jgi:pSer/pThr/pTyr-binding forkhead associated (FHA) protein
VDTDGIVVLARFSSRDEFIAKVSGLFLVLSTKIDEQDQVGFSTQVLDPVSARKVAQNRGGKPPADVEVLPIAKAKGNPYPERVSIGRARNCDLVLRDPSVSKLHAHFRVDQPRLELVDNDSQNGTRVNGRPSAAHQPVVVAPGDVINFGTVTVKLVDAGGLHDLLR